MCNYKVCEVCKINKEIKDYLINKEVCYKCIYAMKLKQMKKICKVCGHELPTTRWAYCSKECFAYVKKTERYWTQKVPVVSMEPRKWGIKSFKY